ncbi:MAG: fluoride efflux transporter CrcB [Planctomycetes bacterium]|nr:fluoride efflux transporter CrcB [Planctomycetota bacterium]
MLWNICAVGAGGSIGAVLRFLISKAGSHFGLDVIWGTLAANVLGGLIIGAALEIVLARNLGENARLFLAVGFCGGLTTFSTFSMDNLRILEDELYGKLALNIGLNVTLCLIAVWAGIKLTKAVV